MRLSGYALGLFAISCDIGMGREPTIDEVVGPHEVEVAGAETTTVAILVDLDSSPTITADVFVAIEGVVIDRGPPDDISMQLDCSGGTPSETVTVLDGRTIHARSSDVSVPNEVNCTLAFVPRDPLAAPVFIQWLTSVDVEYDWRDNDADVEIHIDVMEP